MELRYIVLTIIKILLSVPSIVLNTGFYVETAALIKEHIKPNNSLNVLNSHGNQFSTQIIDRLDVNNNNITNEENGRSKYNDSDRNSGYNEKIPNPSPLVVPGYNLPENIFNRGKPFFLEKDPLTGKVNFSSKTALPNNGDYEYYEDDLSPEVLDKANIDRKDGELYGHHKSHRPSDINQLTPNIHDFLNLPVKYNPDKHVYPLISSSYANTKVQGNVNKLYNHKDDLISYSSYKSTLTPSYNTKPQQSKYDYNTVKTTERPTTTTTKSTTTRRPSTTTPLPNLMNSMMNHPSYDIKNNFQITNNPKPNDIYLTTANINNIYLTTKTPTQFTSTTKRTLSLFEQLFGNFDDIELTERPTTSPTKLTTVTPLTTEAIYTTKTKEFESIPPSVNTEPEYEYEDYYSNENDNIAVESTQPKMEIKANHTTQLLLLQKNEKPSETSSTTTTTPKLISSHQFSSPSSSNKPTKFHLHFSSPTTSFEPYSQSTSSSSTTRTTEKVTSLPLGDNHFGSHYKSPPLLSFSQDVRENLNKEKVPQIQTYDNTILRPVPSSNNIRIPAHQDTVSFVVGNHQNVQGDSSSYTGDNNNNDDNIQMDIYDGSYDNGYYRPFSSGQNVNNPQSDSVQYSVRTKIETGPTGGNTQRVESSITTVNLQPIRTSEASLSIGMPLDSVKKIPGQVVDEKLENENIKFPKKGSGAKIVFPKDDQFSSTSKKPLPPKQVSKQPPPNREVLSLNSKPIFHQLPSDLTPPSETEVPHSRIERPRPPWDPRPGHFYNGRPEYSRPPKPFSKYEPSYKRIDTLPNILPQFRPNVKANSGPHYMDHKKGTYLRPPPPFNHQPNRPQNYFEKLTPPAPPKHLQNLRKLPPPPQYEPDIDPSETNFQFLTQHHKTSQAVTINPINFTPKPPLTKIANRRQSEGDEIETLQMIQAKTAEIKDNNSFVIVTPKETTQNPLYVVYPVNSSPLKMETGDKDKKESVIMGTRAELPLPPTKIREDFGFVKVSNRDNDPVLKPQTKPASSYNDKTEFPYRLEKPEFPSSSTSTENYYNLDGIVSNNQWNSLDDADPAVNNKNSNEISANLPIFTENPIAVAYTPTEPHIKNIPKKHYSMPNYGGPVISEILDDSFPKLQVELENKYQTSKKKYFDNHKIYEEPSSGTKDEPPKLDFQAPFQASINLDSVSQGWTVVRNKDKSEINRSDEDINTTTSVDTTSEFDIEHFKPQLFGGFKPIYEEPDESGGNITDRKER